MSDRARTWTDNVRWIGRLPSSWQATTVRRVATFRDERNQNHDSRLLSLSAYTGVREKVLDAESRSRTGEELEKYWRVRPQNLVVNPMWLNHGSIAVSEIPGVISPDYRIYDLRADLLPRYAHFVFRSRVYRTLYGVLTRGHTTYDRRISKDDFGALPFAVPPTEYQIAIADFLDRKTAAIDALIEKKERLIALLAEKRAALIHQAVTKGLDATVPMKDSGVPWIGEIPAHWEVKRLKFLADVRGGVTKGQKHGDQATEFRPYLRVANVQDGHVSLGEVHEIEVRKQSVTRFELRAGDILMNEGGDNDKLGRGAVWEGQIPGCLHQNHVFAVRPGLGTNPYWVNLAAQSPYLKFFFFSRAVQSTNLASISANNLKQAPITWPPVGEQKEILDRLEVRLRCVAELSSRVARHQQLLREYRQALITAAVTGQLEIPKAVA